MSTLKFTAYDAGFALLVSEHDYRYLVTSDNEPFSYFLNPAVYGKATRFVRWDEATETWEAQAEHPQQYLDDRYGVGANYVTELYGRQPYGANLPGIFVKLNAANEFVAPDTNNLRLQKAYSDAVIVPYLVVRSYEERLASYEYYSYLGAPLGDGTGGTIDVTDGILAMNKETLIETMANAFASALQNGTDNGTGVDGTLFTAFKNFTGLDIRTEYDADERLLSVRNMFSRDGYEVRGEKAGELASGHYMNANITLPGLTKLTGHQYGGFKPMRGVHTVFAPEKLGDLIQVVTNTIDTLAGVTEGQKASLIDELGYHWYDFFASGDQSFTIKLPAHLQPRTQVGTALGVGGTTLTVESTSGFADVGTLHIGQEVISYADRTETQFLGLVRGEQGTTAVSHAAGETVSQPHGEVRANVALSAMGSQLVGATVSIEDPNNPGQFLEVANSQGVNLNSGLSYVDGQHHNPYPADRRYVTGPNGARGIVADDGTVTWLNDAYSV